MSEPAAHILHDIWLDSSRVGETLHASGSIDPVMWVPGTTSVRTSVLATWTDTAAGLLAVDLIKPRVPVTLELDVHVYRRPPASGVVNVVAQAVKTGRAVNVLTVEMTDGDGEPLAMGTASFMAAPDPELMMPAGRLDRPRVRPAARGAAALPLAERARCERTGPGVAVLPRSADGLNASNTVNGGLIALAVEEAALSLAPGDVLESMAMRYLRPVRIGPAVATAHVHNGLGRVEVRDAGAGDRLAVVATTRTLGMPPSASGGQRTRSAATGTSSPAVWRPWSK